jgi:hypothetical protein
MNLKALTLPFTKLAPVQAVSARGKTNLKITILKYILSDQNFDA